jgi:hypothetical protein
LHRQGLRFWNSRLFRYAWRLSGWAWKILVRGIFGSLPHVGNRRLHALLYIAPQHPQRLFNASAAFRDRFLGPSEVHQTDVAQSRRQYQVWQFVQHPAEVFVRNT